MIANCLNDIDGKTENINRNQNKMEQENKDQIENNFAISRDTYKRK